MKRWLLAIILLGPVLLLVGGTLIEIARSAGGSTALPASTPATPHR